MNEPNTDVLFTEVKELESLINDSNKVLNQSTPVSDLASDYERSLSKNSSVIGAQLGRCVSKGRIEQAVIGGAVLGAIWVGAKGIDLISNYRAKLKAKDSLLAYYRELMVKKSLIDKKRDVIMEKLRFKALQAEAEYQRLQTEMQQLESILHRIEAFQAKVE
jgi:hypothetical protein